MKIRIDGYEVEIKAKATWGDRTKANKQDTMDLLNRISIWAMEAAGNPKNNGIKDLLEKTSNEIYGQLEAAGAYENL